MSEKKSLGPVRLSAEDRLAFASDWNLMALYTLFDLPTYKFDVVSAASRLNISIGEVERHLRVLEGMSIIKSDGEGGFVSASRIYTDALEMNVESLIPCFKNLVINMESRVTTQDVVMALFEVMHPTVIGKYHDELRDLIHKISAESLNLDGAEVYVFTGAFVPAGAPKTDELPSSIAAQKFAHDIRSPLSALNAVANRFTDLPEDIREILESATSRINAIAEEILTRTKTIKSKAGMIGIDLSLRLNNLIQEMKLIHANNPIIMTSKDIVFIGSSKSEIVRVVSNLINNAVEASESGKEIFVSCHRSNSRVSVTVTDMGQGMSEETLNKIKLTSHTTKDGNGLGIRSAYEFADKFSGSIDISSKVGVGTQVTIYFED